MTPTELLNKMRAEIRGRFFADYSTERWMRERTFVDQAITFPARYLNERRVRLLGTRYREILMFILGDIESHMRANPRRMSMYLLKAVQDHMKHQGERYYKEATNPKTAGVAVEKVLARLKQAQKDVTVPVLAETHKALATRSQRRCKPAAETQQDIFKASAKRAS
jgi:hypothetical protein